MYFFSLFNDVVIMGMLLAVNVDKQPMLPTVDSVIKKIFHDPADAFYTGRAMDLMYDGVGIDCSSDDALVTAVCMQFEDEKAFRKDENGQLSFSLFAGVSVFILS